MKQDTKRGLFASTVLASLAFAPLTFVEAQAQEAAKPADAEAEAIIVTGSRIPQANLVTTSPVTQVTSADIKQSGVTRIEDLTNQLPQVFAGQGANVSNGATGTATVNLRGLGAVRTLVLIDGRRMGYGSPNATAADLNQIPGSMVERVEVLTGGASAVYGSDALAGVVNFIMKDDQEGLRLDAQYGFYQHNNDFEDGYLRQVIAARALTNPAQFKLPDEDVVDGYSKEITASLGASTPDGRGNVTGYLTYRSNDAILQSQRDFSACSLAASSPGGQSTAALAGKPAGQPHFLCGGSSTSFPGRFTNFGSISQTLDQTTGLFTPFNAGLNQYNFGPLNFFQRPDERYSAGFFGKYEINEHVEAYAQAMFSDYRSVAQIAPSGVFLGNTTNCGNPLLPANKAAIGCDAAAVAADSPAPIYIGRRNVEGGGRQDDLNYTSYRLVSGVRGAINSDWTYDVSGTYSRVNLSRTYFNDFSITRINRALDVVSVGGVPTCRSVVDGTDPSCVPYNIFTPNGVTAAQLNYLQIPLVQRGETIQQNVVATVGGSLPWASPFASSKISTSFGVEYLRNELTSIVDTSFASGDGAGQGGPTLPLSGVTDNFDVFGEAKIPLIEDQPFADLLSIDLAFRRSSYNSGEDSNTYKAGAEWAPVEDIRFRGSYQKAIRAANVIELFSAQQFGLFNGSDPCSSASAPAACFSNVNPLAQVTTAQATGGGLTSPAGQYNQFIGGNPTVSPEEAETKTFGIVFQPSYVPGLAISIDYFDIDITDAISTPGAQNILNTCYATNNAATCNLIQRNPGNGSLFQGSGRVINLNTNIGGSTTKGYDINASYTHDIGSKGSLSFNLVGTYLDELITDTGIFGQKPFDCVGLFSQSASCGTPNPKWRHRFQTSWETPWDVELNVTWRYYDEVKREIGSGVQVVPGLLDSKFPSESYFDVGGTWQVRDNASVRFGVKNITDEDPSIAFATANGNTFPQVYDTLGRYVFFGAAVDF